MTLKHQYAHNAQHRIVKLTANGFLGVAGEWTSYNNIATFSIRGITYIAVTKAFEGTLKPDVIYQLSETEFESEKSILNNPLMNNIGE